VVPVQKDRDGPLSADEIRRLVDSLRAIPEVRADADPALKAKVYSELGVRITYEPGDRLVEAEAVSPVQKCVSEGGLARSGTTHWKLQPSA
jgi:hypothetical protein